MRATCVSTGLAVVLGWAAGGCTDPNAIDVLTYEEFEAQAYRDPVTGVYVVNGDEPVATEEGLREVYDAYLDTVTLGRDPGHGTTEQGLILNTVSGMADRWSSAQVRELRYCVSTLGFGLRYTAVVNAMAQAAAAWESVANVKFTHDVLSDALCDTAPSTVTFDVRAVCGANYYAVAFFPSTPRAQRILRIDCQVFGNISPVTVTGVLRHELGHVLGFRHEHTRPEAGTCFENNNWGALTPYDPYSVMHYPHCNGKNTGDLRISQYDAAGAKAVYP